MKNLLPIYYPNSGIYYRSAPAENERADGNSRKPATLDWQPLLKVEHYRLKQHSVKHPVELKEDAPPCRANER